jgi:hypothetical protein
MCRGLNSVAVALSTARILLVFMLHFFFYKIMRNLILFVYLNSVSLCPISKRCCRYKNNFIFLLWEIASELQTDDFNSVCLYSWSLLINCNWDKFSFTNVIII